MNLAQHTDDASRMHLIKRRNKRGDERVYAYKLFRVKRCNGRITTVSMDHFDHLDLVGRFKPGQRLLSSTVGEAYRHLEASNGWRKGLGRSAQAIALAGKMLDAKRRGVAMEDLLHAEANNEAWE